MAGNKKSPNAIGMVDPAVIQAIAQKIPPNPVTGRVEIPDVLKYLTNHPDEMEKVMAQMDKRDASIDGQIDNFDFGSLENTIVHESFWVVQMETMGFVDPAGKSVHPDLVHSTPGAKPTCVLYCYDDKEKHRNVENIVGLPTSDVLLQFIKTAIATPLPPLKPALPWFLLLSSRLKLHAEYLKPFLDSLPKPFHWRIETDEEATKLSDGIDQMNQTGVKIYMEFAEKAKADANAAFKARDRVGAIKGYSDAIDHLVDALSQKPKEEEEKQAHSLLAICFANRAAAYLIHGAGMDAKKAAADGENAVKVDPDYAKGYIRQAAAWQCLGDVEKAKDIIAQALSRSSLEHESGLIDRLIELYTDGQGLSDDEGIFKNWTLDIWVNDRRSAERLKNVKGGWEARLNEKLKYWAHKRGETKD
ncbi:hypothetical protein ONZ45_g7062 [Pleurotus djamor]|nr:hypothetical protein ONZ45_g7062 [Pleurotus djamor]